MWERLLWEERFFSLYEPTGGKIIYDGQAIYDNPLGPDGQPLGKAKSVNMLPYRRKMQII